MKSFFWGITVEFLILAISFLIKEFNFFLLATGLLAFGSLFISGVIYGVIKDNFYRNTIYEGKNERALRINRAMKVFFFSLPSTATFFTSILL
ncbi:hypothetical protein BD780_001767 [Clostridium tetanomorphum]|uniref:Uncharacterized protein n=1 Tax=Clostridium tetanomorphum TaxID=1553 RepID=A0A923J322_CLOTT|nr:hypothetical protein [Clostridium tetanomorphum]KAJ51868.1 hypothetical protein CTM_10286 [Clostridium tetanomorphum DSM 665]MBC2399518.1 hypothetical protein [Clostridium tetanomorphum]MBP1864129.1 hypothetical protein [Clostridium tetanomorphum]NRS84542.1 hypothetical protein [Clostridium tetanomorphum]NRZ97756.1 hypothetical protein [Clostridium tetanomorphum]